MKLEDIVCSLELSKKLKDIGTQQNSLYYWTNTDTDCPKVILPGDVSRGADSQVSAFTGDELLNILPFCFAKDIDDFRSPAYYLGMNRRMLSLDGNVNNFKYYYCVNYFMAHNEVQLSDTGNLYFPVMQKNFIDKFTGQEKFSDALATVLIHLVENKLWTIEKFVLENGCVTISNTTQKNV